MDTMHCLSCPPISGTLYLHLRYAPAPCNTVSRFMMSIAGLQTVTRGSVCRGASPVDANMVSVIEVIDEGPPSAVCPPSTHTLDISSTHSPHTLHTPSTHSPSGSEHGVSHRSHRRGATVGRMPPPTMGALPASVAGSAVCPPPTGRRRAGSAVCPPSPAEGRPSAVCPPPTRKARI